MQTLFCGGSGPFLTDRVPLGSVHMRWAFELLQYSSIA